VAKEIAEGTLGGDFDRADRAELQTKVGDAEDAAKDEVWGGYRFVVIADNQEPDGLKTIDLGAGHSSGGETLCGRVITALKSQALLSESVGSGYIGRNWPPALKESGAWPLSSLRQSFLNGSLTRLLDPDAVLRTKIPEFVVRGEFGLASGRKTDGTYERIWYQETVGSEEVSFEPNVLLLLKEKAKALKTTPVPEVKPESKPEAELPGEREPLPPPGSEAEAVREARVIRLAGSIPPELWNRFGTKVIPKLRSGKELAIEVKLSTELDPSAAKNLETELRQMLQDLGLTEKVRID
jgi:hypothetical protein